MELWKSHHTKLVELLPPLKESLRQAGVCIFGFYQEQSEQLAKPSIDVDNVQSVTKEIEQHVTVQVFSKGSFSGASGFVSKNPKVYTLDMEDTPSYYFKGGRYQYG